MARYRAGLNLALPAFDTCGCLRNFARNPRDVRALLAYRCLRRRAEGELLYDALARGGSTRRARALLSLRTGISERELADNLLPYGQGEDGATPREMTGDEAMAIYRELCARHGIEIDRSDSMSASTCI